MSLFGEMRGWQILLCQDRSIYLLRFRYDELEELLKVWYGCSSNCVCI